MKSMTWNHECSPAVEAELSWGRTNALVCDFIHRGKTYPWLDTETIAEWLVKKGITLSEENADVPF